MPVKITSLVDTRVAEGLLPEFGLSLLIEACGKRLLLDTGAGETLLPNAAKLHIELNDISAIILSHGHNDHTAGLGKLAPHVPLYVAPGIETPCCSRHQNGQLHWLTMPQDAQKVLNNADLRIIRKPTEIMPGIFLSGPIPRCSGEDCGGDFFSDAICTHPSIIPEEQALLFKDGILVTGCCHAGIINTVEAFRNACPQIPIRSIVGGLHLLHADKQRLQQTAAFLRTLNLSQLVLLHCTGDAACRYFADILPCQVIQGKAGDTFRCL